MTIINKNFKSYYLSSFDQRRKYLTKHGSWSGQTGRQQLLWRCLLLCFTNNHDMPNRDASLKWLLVLVESGCHFSCLFIKSFQAQSLFLVNLSAKHSPNPRHRRSCLAVDRQSSWCSLFMCGPIWTCLLVSALQDIITRGSISLSSLSAEPLFCAVSAGLLTVMA